MITKNQIKLIKSLSLKKNRDKHNLFIAEGPKIVDELLKSEITLKTLYSTSESYTTIDRSIMINSMELKKISNFKSPNNVLALFEIPNAKKIDFKSNIIALDEIKDPGNFGTIIRLCDWFGLSELFCSYDTVDCFNPKVIQASAGSIVRVRCHYFKDLAESLQLLEKPIIGATMKGESVYSTKLIEKASYVFGSEAHGISKYLITKLNDQISIPQFSSDLIKPESLNVASATAIFLSELKRNNN